MRSTKTQRDEVERWHPGAGWILWNNGIGISEVDIFINRKTKQVCYQSTGKPVDLEVVEDVRHELGELAHQDIMCYNIIHGQ